MKILRRLFGRSPPGAASESGAQSAQPIYPTNVRIPGRLPKDRRPAAQRLFEEGQLPSGIDAVSVARALADSMPSP